MLVFCLQNCAYALQRQTHIDIEILRVTRREILSVWIKGTGNRVHEGLIRVNRSALVHSIELVLIALGQQLEDVFILFACQAQVQH